MKNARSLTNIILIVLVVAGVAIRIQRIDQPDAFTFDEEVFVKNAHNYLIGLPDQNDHPPLGKFALAASILAFGYNSLGFRAASLCVGIQTLFVAYWLARCLFRDARAGWFAAAFFAADGFLIAYSRVALLDGLLTCLILLSVLAAVLARRARDVALSAILIGLAMSVKWSGAFAVFPVAAILFLERRVPRLSLLLLALAPLVHIAIWTVALRITDKPADLVSLAHTMRDLFIHHVELGHKPHELASPWYTWPILYHPIVVKWWLHGATNHYASTVGNPVLWYAATAATLSLPLVAIARNHSRVRAWLDRQPFALAPLRAELYAALGWLALIAPWVFGRGTYTFSYHYLPPYSFALLLLAAVVARIERAHPLQVRSFAVATLLAFVYFAPVWGEFSITEGAANRRLIFASWRP